MTFDEWYDEYDPVADEDENVWHESVPEDTDVHHVWTVVEGFDGSLWLVAGYAFVNRLHHAITKKAWEDDSISVLYLEADDN